MRKEDKPILKFTKAEQRARMRTYDRYARRAREAYKRGYAYVLVSFVDFLKGPKRRTR